MAKPIVIFQNERGFITDFQEPQFAVEQATGTVVMEIPRFGVWERSSRGKSEVTLTTNNYAEALAKLESPKRHSYVGPYSTTFCAQCGQSRDHELHKRFKADEQKQMEAIAGLMITEVR